MKLAEALQERADLVRRISELQSRLSANALVQEGESPAEEPAELLLQLNECTTRLEYLIARINATNCATVSEGKTLTDLLAQKDALTLRLGAYRTLVNAASQTARRATRSEIKIVSCINVREIQQQADQMARDLRLLDNRLQQANWTTDLLES